MFTNLTDINSEITKLNGKLKFEVIEIPLNYFGYNAKITRFGNVKQLIYWNSSKNALSMGNEYKIATLPNNFRPANSQAHVINIIADGSDEIFPVKITLSYSNGEITLKPLGNNLKIASLCFSFSWI